MQRARRLADQLARELLAAARVEATPPIDVARAARCLGADVQQSEIAEDGHLVVLDPLHALIRLRDGQPAVRQRFTLAHELGHWSLRSPRFASTSAAATRQQFTSEEVMCDAVAGALLMPRAWLMSTFPEAAELAHDELALVARVARAAGASMGAAIIRLRDVFGWRRMLLHWVPHDGGWLFDSHAGVMPWERRRVRPTRAAGFTLMAIGAETAGVPPDERRPTHRWLPLIVDGVEGDHLAEILVFRDLSVALIDAPASPRSARPTLCVSAAAARTY